MKNKKNNKKIRLLIIMFILLIVLLILTFVMSYLKNYDEQEEAQKDFGYQTMPVYQDPKQEYVPEKELKYANIGVLSELKGDLPTSTAIKIVRTVFVEEIPQLLDKVKGYNQTKLKEYYNSNTQDIINDCRVSSEEDFLKMIDVFSALTSDLTKDFSSCEFTSDGELGLKFSYENGETIECKINGENANLITFEF